MDLSSEKFKQEFVANLKDYSTYSKQVIEQIVLNMGWINLAISIIKL